MTSKKLATILILYLALGPQRNNVVLHLLIRVQNH